MDTLGAVLVGVVWGWALVLVAARAPCGRGSSVASVLASAIMALGLGVIRGGPVVLWFAAGAVAGLLAHAAWLEDLRRRCARRQAEGGSR
jgi:hypothetical protein